MMFKITKKSLVMVSAALFTTLSINHAALALTPFNATYQFSYGNRVLGDATRVLTEKDNIWQYQFISKIPLVGSASEVSRFQFQQGQIQSLSFVRQTKILVRSDNISLNFNPQKKQIATSRRNQKRMLTWQNHVLDDLNAELQVREDLQHGGLKSSYLIADDKQVSARQFVQEGNETVQAANGQRYETIRVRLKHDDPKRNTFFWLAPSLNYLPVKVTHQDNQNTYSLLLKRQNS